MYGCVYRTKDGECDLYSEGGKFKAFCDPEHCDNIAPTNADRIRAMTDKELAEYLIVDVEAEAIRRAGRYLTANEVDRAIVDCLNWLRQEAAE